MSITKLLIDPRDVEAGMEISFSIGFPTTSGGYVRPDIPYGVCKQFRMGFNIDSIDTPYPMGVLYPDIPVNAQLTVWNKSLTMYTIEKGGSLVDEITGTRRSLQRVKSNTLRRRVLVGDDSQVFIDDHSIALWVDALSKNGSAITIAGDIAALSKADTVYGYHIAYGDYFLSTEMDHQSTLDALAGDKNNFILRRK